MSNPTANLEQPFSTTTAQVFTYDCQRHRAVAVQIVAQGGSSSVGFQCSNDGINWVSVVLVSLGATSGSAASTGVTSTGLTGIFTGPVLYRFFRLNVTGIVSATTSGVVEFSPYPASLTLPPGTAADNADGLAGSAVGGTRTVAEQFQFNGATFDRVRVPVVFKTVTTAAGGNTALWTPAAGKKFRLMRFIVDVTSNAASAGGVVDEITFQDAAVAMPIGFSVFAPAVAVTTTQGGFTSGWIDLGNGILSSTINNALNVNLSAALSAGEVRVTACGTEE